MRRAELPRRPDDREDGEAARPDRCTGRGARSSRAAGRRCSALEQIGIERGLRERRLDPRRPSTPAARGRPRRSRAARFGDAATRRSSGDATTHDLERADAWRSSIGVSHGQHEGQGILATMLRLISTIYLRKTIDYSIIILHIIKAWNTHCRWAGPQPTLRRPVVYRRPGQPVIPVFRLPSDEGMERREAPGRIAALVRQADEACRADLTARQRTHGEVPVTGGRRYRGARGQ